MEAENKIPKQNKAELEVKIVELETEISNLKAEVTDYKAKAEDFKSKLKGIDGINNRCLCCGKKTGNFIYKGKDEDFPTMNTMDCYYFICEDENCGKKYKRQADLQR
jgi:hypothetical protein